MRFFFEENLKNRFKKKRNKETEKLPQNFNLFFNKIQRIKKEKHILIYPME